MRSHAYSIAYAPPQSEWTQASSCSPRATMNSTPSGGPTWRSPSRCDAASPTSPERDASATHSSRRTPDYLDSGYRWRPFQLAFQLLTLPSIANEDDDDRDIVDLIWFPTGGGKTEAYLALAAFQIFLRRLRHGEQRRRDDCDHPLHAPAPHRAAVPARRGADLRREWIRRAAHRSGSATSRSRSGSGSATRRRRTSSRRRWSGSRQLDRSREPIKPFQLERCPWCGTELDAGRARRRRRGYGVDAGNTHFRLFCPERRCEFHERCRSRSSTTTSTCTRRRS